MLNKPHVLIATDFSYCSELALKAAEALRKKLGGQSHVVHVASYPAEWDWLTNSVEVNYLPDKYKHDLVKNLNRQLENQIKNCEVQCTGEIVFGKPFKAIVETIARKKIDLLIIGHRGAGTLHGFLGGLTSKIIASSEIPVLVINTDLNLKKVAGLVDTEEPVKEIFSIAEGLSTAFSSKLEFISLWPDLTPGVKNGSAVSASGNPTYSSEQLSHIKDLMKRKIQSHLHPQSQAEVVVDITSEKSIPDAIVKKLDEERVDLAVMSRHRMKILERMFIGSVARRMLDMYSGNMLVLPPGKG